MKAKIHSKPRKTVLVETNILSSNIAVNRQIKWDEINFPDNWVIPNAVQPQSIINQEIDQITQTIDGEVENVFNPSRTILLSDVTSTSRRSISRSGSYRTNDVKGINISENHIPHALYKEKEKNSPTSSEMSFRMPG